MSGRIDLLAREFDIPAIIVGLPVGFVVGGVMQFFFVFLGEYGHYRRLLESHGTEFEEAFDAELNAKGIIKMIQRRWFSNWE